MPTKPEKNSLIFLIEYHSFLPIYAGIYEIAKNIRHEWHQLSFHNIFPPWQKCFSMRLVEYFLWKWIFHVYRKKTIVANKD